MFSVVVVVVFADRIHREEKKKVKKCTLLGLRLLPRERLQLAVFWIPQRCKVQSFLWEWFRSHGSVTSETECVLMSTERDETIKV